MDNRNNDRDRFEKSGDPDLHSEPIKAEACQSAVVLGIIGAVVGLFLIPFIGVTFALAGLYVNSAEAKYYKTGFGLKVNIISIIISAVSWIIAVIFRQVT